MLYFCTILPSFFICKFHFEILILRINRQQFINISVKVKLFKVKTEMKALKIWLLSSKTYQLIEFTMYFEIKF